MAKLTEDGAFDLVAAWHDQQARRFCEMAKDEPRIDGPTRTRAAEAARHHSGSAAALRLKASDMRRSALSQPGDGR